MHHSQSPHRSPTVGLRPSPFHVSSCSVEYSTSWKDNSNSLRLSSLSSSSNSSSSRRWPTFPSSLPLWNDPCKLPADSATSVTGRNRSGLDVICRLVSVHLSLHLMTELSLIICLSSYTCFQVKLVFIFMKLTVIKDMCFSSHALPLTNSPTSIHKQ